MKEGQTELKQWLAGLLPDGMSREDVAVELGVTRKTISTMLNPEQPGWPSGLTMLRYLQLAGAVVEAPTASPGASRLAAVEAAVADLPTRAELQEAIETLREAIDRVANPGTGETTQTRSVTP